MNPRMDECAACAKTSATQVGCAVYAHRSAVPIPWNPTRFDLSKTQIPASRGHRKGVAAEIAHTHRRETFEAPSRIDFSSERGRNS